MCACGGSRRTPTGTAVGSLRPPLAFPIFHVTSLQEILLKKHTWLHRALPGLAVGLLLFAGNAGADPLTDAQVQNLLGMAQTAYSNADVAEARGDRVGAARWRQTGQNFERRAETLRRLAKIIEDGANKIAHDVHPDYTPDNPED